MNGLTLALFALSAAGLLLLLAEGRALRRQLAGPPPRPGGAAGISVLKPLRGVDDDLEANLASFAALAWPRFEVLLGLAEEDDPAAPVARAAAARWPAVFRVVLQEGAPGLNPKVNQLITLARAARHDLLVVSDSNVRVQPGYLAEIAARLEDPGVGLVTHLISGVGERTPGALLENLHLAGGVAPGIAAAKRLVGRDVVMGKSMALRRRDLEALGGFEGVMDLLAEDYVLGRLVPERLGLRVEIASRPIENVIRDRTLMQFALRARRWSVLQRYLVGAPTYAGQIVRNPTFVALLGLAAGRTSTAAAAFAAVTVARTLLDAAAGRALRPNGFRRRDLLLGPVKDLALAAGWVEGFFGKTVDWRGTRLRVLPGARLERMAPPPGTGGTRAASPGGGAPPPRR
jgi:ceramide glucosyltransferase